MATKGAGSDFSPLKEIWKRAGDGVYKTLKKFVIWMGRYIYALFIPNLLIYLFVIVFLSPLWGGVVVVYPPLRYFCTHSQEITGLLNSGSNDVNLALQEAAQGINDVLQVLTPVFQIWNIIVDWILWVGIRIFQFFNCAIGQECEGFLQLFRWIRNFLPFVVNIFLVIWRGIGGIFSDITPLSTVGDPQNLTTVTMLNGSVFLVDAFHPDTGTYQHMVRLDENTPEWASHRFLLTKSPISAEHRKRTPYPFGSCGNDPSQVCVDPSNSCTFGSVDVCQLIMDIVNVLLGAEDAFVLFLQIIDLILQHSLDLIYDAVNLFLDVILPFFQWLIGFIGGDLIGFFSDLFSKVNALFTWVGDVWDSFVDLWNDAIDTIFDFFGSLIDDLDQFFTDLWDSFLDYIDNIIDVFASILQDIVADLIDKIQDIVNDLTSGLASIFSIGRNAQQGRAEPPTGGEGHVPTGEDMAFDLQNQVRSVVGDGIPVPPKQFNAQIGGVNSKRSTPNGDGVAAQSFKYQYKRNFSVMRDLAAGNLTSGDRSICREAFRYGLDMYTLAQMPVMQRLYVIGCLSFEEVTTYRDEYLAARELLGPAARKRHTRVFDAQDGVSMTSAHFAVRTIRESLNQTMKRVKSKHAEFRERTAFLKSSSEFITEAREHARGARGEPINHASIFSSNFTEALTDLSQMLQNVTASSLGTRPGVSGMEQMKDRVRKIKTRQDASEERVRAIRHTWDKLKKQPAVASIAERLTRLGTEDWALHRIRVRYPAVDIEGTPEHSAYKQAVRFNDHWDDLGRFLSRQPSAEEIGHYLSTEGSGLVEMLKMSVEGARMQRRHMRREMLNPGKHGLRGNPGADFWQWITVGLWETLGEAILNVVNFFIECNPLPQPVGPGGDPNTQVDPVRYCLPYWNPDARLPVDDIRIPFDLLFPSCCPPGFDCPSEYKNIYGQLRFLMRFITLKIPLWWGWLTWVPVFGPWWDSFTQFPGGNIPDYAFYCFFTCISEPVMAITIGIFVAVTVIAWFIPIILVLWLLVTWCCILSFACCRTVCLPCKVCTPRSPKNLMFTRDSRFVRGAVSTVPGLGWLEPKGGKANALFGLVGDSLVEHLEGDDPFEHVTMTPWIIAPGAAAAQPPQKELIEDEQHTDQVDQRYMSAENVQRFHPAANVNHRRPSAPPPPVPATSAPLPPPVVTIVPTSEPAPAAPAVAAAPQAPRLPDWEARSYARLTEQ